MANGQPFMHLQRPEIDKHELNNLLVSGGWGGQGTWSITAKPNEVEGSANLFC